MGTFLLRGILVTVVLAIIASLAASRVVTNYVLEQASKEANVVTSTVLTPALGEHVSDPSPEMAPMWRSHIQPITEQFDVVAVKVWSRDGTVVYAENPALIGTSYPPDPDFSRALQDISSVKLISSGDGIGAGVTAKEALLRIYVPVHRPGSNSESQPVVGVYEVYQRYAPLQARITGLLVAVWGFSVLAFGTLFVSLYALIRSASRQLERLAFFDPLTGLANRQLLREKAEAQIALAKRHGSSVAMLYLDLNRFKAVNDSLGHSAGDDLLKQVALRLGEVVRTSDTLARLGGDEFALVLEGDQVEARRAARRLLSRLREPFTVREQAVRIDASVGIALLPEDSGNFEELTKHADIAMYRAKKQGGGVGFYRPELDTFTDERLKLEQAVREQLEGDGAQFEVYYQPLVVTDSGKTFGFEALIRWNHPERGLVPPGSFLSIIEEIGLEGALDRLVLARAVAQTARWHAQGQKVRISVNISSPSFGDPKLASFVAQTISQAKLVPSALMLEITEGTAMGDEQRTLQALEQLKALGVLVALDDFGTGHSSLAYLKKFPIDCLKIDRSFLNDLHDPKGADLLQGIIGLGSRLGMRVLVEGVETQAQLDWLQAHGCRLAQGFLFGKPVPANIAIAEPTRA